MNEKKFCGEVLSFDPKKGYGFIGWNKFDVQQKDLFVHFSDIICDGFKTLNKGQKVEFELGSNRHGNTKAVNVTLTSY